MSGPRYKPGDNGRIFLAVLAVMIGGFYVEMPMPKELSREEVGTLQRAAPTEDFMVYRGAVSAAYGPVPINGYVPESAVGLDARLVPLSPPVLSVPSVAASEEGSGRADNGDGGSAGVLPDVRPPDVFAVLPYVTAPTDTYTQFFEGYFAAEGQYSQERIDAMIQCESSWRLDPGGYHLGLAQFAVGTWATVSAITGYTDWLDAYSQGYNVAVWASMISPGTSAGWPSCFSAIDW